ncbi:MAG: Hsp20 family protein [Terrimicrobiaceae bacterium]
MERAYGSFMRSFTLPEGTTCDKFSAEFKEGALKVRLPKSEEAKPKSIDVKVGQIPPPSAGFPMRKVIFISEIVAAFEDKNGLREVCATGDASCDETKSRLQVNLNSFLRRTDLSGDSGRVPWLPLPRP